MVLLAPFSSLNKSRVLTLLYQCIIALLSFQTYGDRRSSLLSVLNLAHYFFIFWECWFSPKTPPLTHGSTTPLTSIILWQASWKLTFEFHQNLNSMLLEMTFPSNWTLHVKATLTRMLLEQPNPVRYRKLLC